MQDRRQFLTTVIRGGIFASLVALFGVMAGRKNEDANCQQDFSCGNCGVAKGCRLPEADSYRLNLARRAHSNQKDERIGK